MGIFDFVKSLFSDDEQDEQAAVLERMAADREDPRKAFVFAVLCCTEDRDPGYLSDYAKEAVTNWYGVESGQEILDMGTDYFKARDYPAYNYYRLLFVARCGAGAGMLDEATAWSVAFRHAAELQRHYPDWQSFAQGYLSGHLSYRKLEGDSPETLADRRATVQSRLQQCQQGWWSQIPWNTRFS